MAQNTLLVGVDESPASRRAVVWVAQQASATGAAVLAAHVLTYSAEFARDFPPTGLTTWRQTLRDRLQHEWVEPLREARVPYRAVVVEDDTVEGGLLRLSAENGVALIVLGAHGHGNLKDRLLGGATYKIAHRADRPVVIVPADWIGPEA